MLPALLYTQFGNVQFDGGELPLLQLEIQAIYTCTDVADVRMENDYNPDMPLLQNTPLADLAGLVAIYGGQQYQAAPRILHVVSLS